MALKSGLQLFTYRLEGTLDSPTAYNLVTHVRDEALDMDRTEVDVSSRASVTFRQFVPGLSNGNVETQILHLPGDPNFEAFRDSFFNNTPVLMAFVDNPLQAADFPATTPAGDYDSEGLWGAFFVTNFSEARALEDGHMHDVRFSPTLEPVTNVVPIYKKTTVTVS